MNDIAVKDLKPIIYEILTNISKSNGDVCATQNMGVSLTNSIKKEGVNIIQLQNINIESVVPKLIEALKMIDELDQQYPHSIIEITSDPPKQIEDKNTPTDEFLLFLIENNLTYKVATDIIKVGMYKMLMESGFDRMQSVEKMGVSTSSIAQSKKRLKEGDY